ncbi:uncharacterized protein BT62DRAFT_1074107 [Guyanagaster necrorhizus]|uniref:Uncharacterized protein n=1 Tax=Guyanagaster necrorhizus TaxID=856835 RepID=A0A9P8AW35_9AGAR|nr:uncharacterized protein BT62DRAFT_1074107 [Guyanagaster necrorhizus MCA 3950]KAG7448537.1 hypothetical protein BT62DRAFT_1074107 [Guyanagaster necrorhizus MCA 3950]
MGTRGYYVYRWRGWYFIQYSHLDSYPDGLGLIVCGNVPSADCDPQVFDNWFKRATRRLDGDLEKYRVEKRCRQTLQVNDNYSISRKQPQNDIFIEWIYEIDLDNLVFHVNSIPIFRLDCMPSSGDFCGFISTNHYGGLGYAEDMPECHRYEANWVTSPPEISSQQLEAYKRLEATVEEDIAPLAMSVVSSTRLRLLEAMVGVLMTMDRNTRNIINLHNVSSRDSFTRASLRTLWIFAWTALSPPKYGEQWEAVLAASHYPATVSEDDCLAVWLRENLCVYTWTHLDDEPNLKAAVVTVIECMRSRHRVLDSFGAVFSLYHCVLVRLEGGTGKVTHTDVLDFLPSWYAYSPSTPGITAVARLCEYLDDLSQGHPDIIVCNTEPLRTQLPHELLARISEHIYDSSTLLAYARASVQTRAACKAMLMKPWVNDLQFLAVHPDSVLCHDEDGPDSAHANEHVEVEDEDGDEEWYVRSNRFTFLSNAKFHTRIFDENHPDAVFSIPNLLYRRDILQALNVVEGIVAVNAKRGVNK